jgi:hypothetical protein
VRMQSSGMSSVALVRNDVSEGRITSIIRVKRTSVLQLLVTANVVPSSPILSTVMMEELRCSEMPFLIAATRRYIQKMAF